VVDGGEGSGYLGVFLLPLLDTGGMRKRNGFLYGPRVQEVTAIGNQREIDSPYRLNAYSLLLLAGEA
jgi:hypothetical protein